MIVVLKHNVPEEKRNQLINWLRSQQIDVHPSLGEYQTVLGLVGDTSRIDMSLLESLDIVDSVKRVSDPFKCCNRKFHPDDTVVSVGDAKFGGGHFAMIAGPCSVESEEQIVYVAKAVKAAGAQLLRGGAFKPRTSPYDFQGLHGEGIRLLEIAKQETGLPIVTELMNIKHLPLFENVDVIQIAAREQEIRSFVPKEFYGVRLKLAGFTAVWRDANGNSRTFDRALAERIAEACRTGTCTIRQVRRMRRMTPPPAAYDLTELQRDANKKYAYSAKETLNLMQALYEQHKLLTYPRTDSRYISDDVVPTLPDRLRAVMTGDYKPFAQELMRRRPLSTRYLVNNAKVTDHHAIIPTEEAPDLWQLSGPERNIYDLVVRRFLAVLMPPCAYEEVELTLRAGDHDFTAKGRIVSEPGWRRVYDRSFRLEDEEEDEPQTLPALEQGQRLSILGASVAVGKTPPPPRYTEATLLTAMEHPQAQVTDKALQKILAETSGLGTPATRADIIEKLFSAFYIERRGKELVPTSKGMQLVELAPEDLRSAALTAQWEDRLARIAKGQERDAKFVEEMRAYASRLVAAVKASDAKYTHDNQTRKTCPDCGKFLLLVKGKRGEMLVCPDRECGYRKSVTQVTNARCPNCFKKMELRGEGENQMFACVCGYREKLSAFQERRKSAGAGKRDVAKYLQQQKDDKPVNSGMADALAKWLEKNQK